MPQPLGENKTCRQISEICQDLSSVREMSIMPMSSIATISICSFLEWKEGVRMITSIVEVTNSTREKKEDSEDSKEIIPFTLSLFHYPMYFLHNFQLLWFYFCRITYFLSSLTRT